MGTGKILLVFTYLRIEKERGFVMIIVGRAVGRRRCGRIDKAVSGRAKWVAEQYTIPGMSRPGVISRGETNKS